MSDFVWSSENLGDTFPASEEGGLDFPFEMANVGIFIYCRNLVYFRQNLVNYVYCLRLVSSAVL